MKRLMRRCISQRGFSIMEMLIALALTGIITTAVFRAFMTQEKHYTAQDDITTIQQNARASIDELTRQIRMAGHAVPMGLAAITVSNANPDTITINYRASDCGANLSVAMAEVTSELKFATAIDCFTEGQWGYIFAPDSAWGEFFEITGVETGSNTLQHVTMNLSHKYPVNSQVMVIAHMKFYVDNTTDAEHPRLMVKSIGKPAAVYAENMTDLQFRYRLKNGSVVDDPALVSDIREVQISITGRSNNRDYLTTGRPYRTRTYASSVNVRNLSN